MRRVFTLVGACLVMALVLAPGAEELPDTGGPPLIELGVLITGFALICGGLLLRRRSS